VDPRHLATDDRAGGRPADRESPRALLKSYPEVATVVSEQGRPDDGIDADGPFIAEFFVPLKPFDEWTSGRTKEDLIREMQAASPTSSSASTSTSRSTSRTTSRGGLGRQGENSIKLFGTELEQIDAKLKQIDAQHASVPQSSRVEHQQEVSSVSGEVMLSPERRNLYLPYYRAAFACSHFRYPHRHRCHLAMAFPCGERYGLPCSAEMTRSVRSALYAGSVDYP